MSSNREYSVILISTTVSRLHVSLSMHTNDIQKISNDILNHCQVEDADDPGTDTVCHPQSHFYAAVLQLTNVHNILFLKIKVFPTIDFKAS